jgi:hypothetical protein
MKRALIVGLAVLAVASCVLASRVLAAEEEKVTVTGTVAVSKDDDGNITAVSVKKEDTVTKIVLDENGKKLAKLAGKKAEVKGTWAGEGDAKMLKVESFKAVEEKKEE